MNFLVENEIFIKITSKDTLSVSQKSKYNYTYNVMIGFSFLTKFWGHLCNSQKEKITIAFYIENIKS